MTPLAAIEDNTGVDEATMHTTDELGAALGGPGHAGGMPTTDHEESSPPWVHRGWVRALLGVLLYLVVTFIVQVPLLIVLFALGADVAAAAEPADLGLGVLFVMQLSGLVAVVLAVWLMRHFVDRRSLGSLGLSLAGRGGQLLEGVAWGAGLIGGVVLCLFALGALTVHQGHTAVGPSTLLVYLLVLAMAAVGEELLMRGYVLANLMASMNSFVALVVSSVLFCAMHALNPSATLLSLVNTALVGVLLGVYYVHRRNLWFPIGIHFAWNYLQGPILGFDVSGLATHSLLEFNLSGSALVTGGEYGPEGSLLTTVLLILAAIAIHLRFRR